MNNRSGLRSLLAQKLWSVTCSAEELDSQLDGMKDAAIADDASHAPLLLAVLDAASFSAVGSTQDEDDAGDDDDDAWAA